MHNATIATLCMRSVVLFDQMTLWTTLSTL